MAVSRAALAAATTGCLLAAGFCVSGISQAWAQSATPGAQAPDAATGPEDNEVATTADAIQPFSMGASVALSELYDSNPEGVPNGPGDAITQGVLDAHIHDQTARFQGDLAYSLAGNYHASLADLNSIQNYLNAIGHAELWVDHLFLSARAYAWPTFLSRLGSLDAGNGTSSSANDRNAYGFIATPDLVFHFQDFARSDLSATQTGEFFSDLSGKLQGVVLPFTLPLSEQSTTVSEKLTGGEYFGRLAWVLSATATNSVQQGLHQLQRVAEADLEYHFDHDFGILANVGYRRYHSRPSLTHGLSGLIAMGGIDFNPSPNFHLVAKAGKQYNFTSYTGNLRWQFGAFTSLVGTLDDVIATPQDRLLLGLQGLGVNQGVFFVPPTPLPDQPPPPSGLPGPPPGAVNISGFNQLALDNTISRYRTATLGLVENLPRTTLALTAYGALRDYLLPVLSFSSRQTIYGGDFTGSYDLTRGFTATGSVDYSVAREFGGLDKIIMVSAGLNYAFSPSWSAFGRVSYLDRNSRNSIVFVNGSLNDVQAGAGLRYNF